LDLDGIIQCSLRGRLWGKEEREGRGKVKETIPSPSLPQGRATQAKYNVDVLTLRWMCASF